MWSLWTGIGELRILQLSTKHYKVTCLVGQLELACVVVVLDGVLSEHQFRSSSGQVEWGWREPMTMTGGHSNRFTGWIAARRGRKECRSAVPLDGWINDWCVCEERWIDCCCMKGEGRETTQTRCCLCGAGASLCLLRHWGGEDDDDVRHSCAALIVFRVWSQSETKVVVFLAECVGYLLLGV